MKSMYIFVVMLCVAACNNESPKTDFKIDSVYDDGMTFVDFEKRVLSPYKIKEDRINIISDLISDSQRLSNTSYFDIAKLIEPDVAGSFSVNVENKNVKTKFINYVFKYNADVNSLNSLTLYFDYQSNSLVGITCPDNIDFNCKNIDLPSDRGAFISFD